MTNTSQCRVVWVTSWRCTASPRIYTQECEIRACHLLIGALCNLCAGRECVRSYEVLTDVQFMNDEIAVFEHFDLGQRSHWKVKICPEASQAGHTETDRRHRARRICKMLNLPAIIIINAMHACAKLISDMPHSCSHRTFRHKCRWACELPHQQTKNNVL